MDEWTIDDLPARFRDVAELISLPSALKLVREYGGRSVYVPLPARIEDHHLAGLLGGRPAEQLSRHYGGGELAVPRLVTLERAARNRAIRVARQDGVTVAALAQKHALTERGIWKILSAP